MTDEHRDVEQSTAETGFGTGLRTKLARHAPGADGNGSEGGADLGRNGLANEAEVIALRAELAAAIDRERGLRAELAAALDARSEHDAAVERDFAARSAELDVRAARLATSEQELELREHRITEQAQVVREERERLS
ncbi:MAG TPA: hypothetical protein VHF23_03420, partial [Gaiellaceae bacterium]|nr:hypothetical protein [Gaiellaceae bacterium]